MDETVMDVAGVGVLVDSFPGDEALALGSGSQPRFTVGAPGVAQIYPDGSFKAANDALATMFGYDTPVELMRRAQNFHRGLFRDSAHRDRFQQMRVLEDPVTMESEAMRSDGTTFWVLEIGRSARSWEGSPEGDEVFVFDIDRYQRAESSLQRFHSRLLDLQEEERRRIARELHDTTGQLLAAMEMNLSRLETWESGIEGMKRVVSETLELVRECSRSTRSLTYLLHPPLLDELGLGFALRQYAEGFSQRSGIRIEVDVAREPVRFGADVERALFRVAQECLSNVFRHSGSEVAFIRMRHLEKEVRLEVEDHGCGVPQHVLEGSDGQLGVGLYGMRERMRQLGGRLDIDSVPGRTLVVAATRLR